MENNFIRRGSLNISVSILSLNEIQRWIYYYSFPENPIAWSLPHCFWVHGLQVDPFLFENAEIFSSAPAYCTHVSADDHRKRVFSKTISRVGIFENAVCVLYACGWMKLVYMSRSHKMVPSPLPLSVTIRHLHISHNTLCQCPRKFCTILDL